MTDEFLSYIIQSVKVKPPKGGNAQRLLATGIFKAKRLQDHRPNHQAQHKGDPTPGGRSMTARSVGGGPVVRQGVFNGGYDNTARTPHHGRPGR